VPAAASDADLEQPLDFDRYADWLSAHEEYWKGFLARLEAAGLLRRITRPAELVPRHRGRVDDGLWSKMCGYLSEEIVSDPYYSDQEPFCHLGGETIYLLRAVDT
jgi:hypothetical protein